MYVRVHPFVGRIQTNTGKRTCHGTLLILQYLTCAQNARAFIFPLTIIWYRIWNVSQYVRRKEKKQAKHTRTPNQTVAFFFFFYLTLFFSLFHTHWQVSLTRRCRKRNRCILWRLQKIVSCVTTQTHNKYFQISCYNRVKRRF